MGFKWPPWRRVELRCSLQSWRGLVVIVTIFYIRRGVKIGLHYTFFFQKHGLKRINIALFFGFSLHFAENRGGSDLSVKNVTHFFFLNEG